MMESRGGSVCLHIQVHIYLVKLHSRKVHIASDGRSSEGHDCRARLRHSDSHTQTIASGSSQGSFPLVIAIYQL